MRKEASSGRRAARGWMACCVLGGVRLGDPASVLPGVLRGIRTTREPAGGRGKRKKTRIRNEYGSFCIMKTTVIQEIRETINNGKQNRSN